MQLVCAASANLVAIVVTEVSVRVKPVAVTHASAMRLLPQRRQRPWLQRPLPTQDASAVFATQVAIAVIQRSATAANANANVKVV